MSIYNEDELVAPKWLSEEFLEKVLRDDAKNDGVKIESLEISPASMKGDHYASCMYRAKIVYRESANAKNTNTCALIIKTLPDEESKKMEMLQDLTLFETEISMYTKALPEIQRVLADHGDNTVFGPRVLYSSLEPRKVIIFEDLCVAGYDCVRGRALNFDEYKIVFKKLAKLHAVSYAIGHGDEAHKVKEYQKGIFNYSSVLENDMMNGGLKRLARLLESDDELRVYLPLFKNVEEEVFQSCIELYNAYKNPDDDEIFVLNHGDFHSRNLMFKHGENEKTEDVMMVDFQISVYGPSIIDLTYATFMMFDPETRLKKRDEIFRFYFDNFIATLKAIEYKGKLPEFGQLQLAGLKYRKFAKYLLATFMPVAHMFTTKPEDIKDVNMDDMVHNTDAMMITYMNPAFIKDLKAILPKYLNKGLLD